MPLLSVTVSVSTIGTRPLTLLRFSGLLIQPGMASGRPVIGGGGGGGGVGVGVGPPGVAVGPPGVGVGIGGGGVASYGPITSTRFASCVQSTLGGPAIRCQVEPSTLR